VGFLASNIMKSDLEVPDHIAVNFFKSNLDAVAMSNVYAARCPVCGDSAKHSEKRRMYLLKKNRTWLVYCHNCEYSASLLKFTKNFFPDNYHSMLRESVGEFFSPVKKEEDDLSLLVEALSQKVKSRVKKTFNKVELMLKKYCIPLTGQHRGKEQQIMIEQIKDLKNRRLSDDFISSLYFVKWTEDDEFKKYRHRIIIPFLDKENRPYYFQAKGTNKYHAANKYINWDDDDKKPIYNEHHVDREKTVYIVEGLIDSLFVKNAVATTGASLSKQRIKELSKEFPKRVWIMDNDKKGISISKRLFKMGETCFLFPKKYKDIKDLNDLAIYLEKNDLTKIVEVNCYNNVEGLIELSGR
jgi:hypothetical protein